MISQFFPRNRELMDHRIAILRARLAAETPGSQVQKTRDRAQQPLGPASFLGIHIRIPLGFLDIFFGGYHGIIHQQFFKFTDLDLDKLQ